ncbi:MAG: NADH-quinone oxidoreductase subunit N [Bacteroidetes bacterium]|nr:NADH-quinone oxidoreductase subunit N [Bacteroidota bacterium]
MNTIIALTVLGVAILFLGILKKNSWLLPTILAGIPIVLILTITGWDTNRHYFNDMLIVDNYAVTFNSVMIFSTFLIFMFAGKYYHLVQRSLDDIYAIVIFALVGCVLMTSYGNLIMLFLGIETLSIALYILAGSHKESITSNEATLKYFLLGSFLSGFLLFGIALIYGASGTFNLDGINSYVINHASHLPPIFKAGLFLMIIGLAFKIAIVPFHFWAPDVYEGTPTLVSAFMVTVVKTASIIALFRLFSTSFSAVKELWEPTLAILAVLTILVGNFTGLYQTNLKRMLAYSSISHSGYMMLAVIAFSHSSANTLLFYAFAYSVATILAFGVLILVREAKGNDLFTSFRGLAKRNPVEAFSLSVAMLSLTGIPPLAGFFAKYYLFFTVMDKGYLWLMIIAIVGSAVSAVYYFKPVISMYLEEGQEFDLKAGVAYRMSLLFLAILTVLTGVLPFFLINLI